MNGSMSIQPLRQRFVTLHTQQSSGKCLHTPQTYYVTLDLTTPQYEPKRRALPKGRRSKTRWINPGLGRNKRGFLKKPPTYSAVPAEKKEGEAPLEEGDEEIEQEEEPENAEQEYDEDGKPIPKAPEVVAITEVSEERPKAPPDVQILDLHTENPVVSYDGHVYSCKWAANIGTELLFTAHDSNNEIPCLRTLPGNVDLLAASSCRLISNSVTVEPRDPIAQRQYKSGSSTRVRGLSIPVGRQASDKRKDQARFLEQIMRLKEEKGEEDLVTIFAVKRQTNMAWRKQMKQQRQQERTKLQGVIRKMKNGSEVDEARQRLQEMDEEDAQRQAADLAKGLGPDGKKLVDGRKRRRGQDDGREDGGKRQKSAGRKKKSGVISLMGRADDERESATPDFVSTAGSTPRIYEDEEGYYEEIDQGQYGELYDEDAPGEEDDTEMQAQYGWQ